MRYLLFLSVMLICSICNAQTSDEWFRQKKTQIKYLQEQIIALHVYGNYLSKGYSIVQDGLSAVHDIKNGDFNLHSNYFSSLKTVNATIANSSKITDIINLQLQILRLNTAINKYLSDNAILSNERTYIRQVMQNILRQCTADITGLTNLTTDRAFELKDDERLKKIAAVYDEMKDKYTFTTHFKEQIALLVLLRNKELNDSQAIQSLYNLK